MLHTIILSREIGQEYMLIVYVIILGIMDFIRVTVPAMESVN